MSIPTGDCTGYATAKDFGKPGEPESILFYGKVTVAGNTLTVAIRVPVALAEDATSTIAEDFERTLGTDIEAVLHRYGAYLLPRKPQEFSLANSKE
jgi:hypothetical protein